MSKSLRCKLGYHSWIKRAKKPLKSFCGHCGLAITLDGRKFENYFEILVFIQNNEQTIKENGS